MATQTPTITRNYPRKVKLGDHSIRLRLMDEHDADNILAFTKALKREDLMYTRMDITKRDVIEDWIQNIRHGRTITVLAEDGDGNIVGYGSLHTNKKLWTRHLGELRLLVTGKVRGIGLGERLAVELMAIADDQELERVVLNIPRTQPHVRKMMEKLGFTAEALLTDWLKDQQGRTHDLIIMSHHLDEA